MSLMFLVAMMMAQEPAAAQPQPVAAQQPAAKKAKPKQVCEYMELTGSRSPRRVCHDVSGDAEPQPGIQSGAYDSTAGAHSSSGGNPGGSN